MSKNAGIYAISGVMTALSTGYFSFDYYQVYPAGGIEEYIVPYSDRVDKAMKKILSSRNWTAPQRRRSVSFQL